MPSGDHCYTETVSPSSDYYYIERLPKRAAELLEQGRRRRGRPILRWEDCVKRDVKKTGEEGDWKRRVEKNGR